MDGLTPNSAPNKSPSAARLRAQRANAQLSRTVTLGAQPPGTARSCRWTAY